MRNKYSFFFVYGALFFVFSPQTMAMNNYSPPLVISAVAFMTNARIENQYDESFKENNIQTKLVNNNKLKYRHKNENNCFKNPPPKSARPPYVASTKNRAIILDRINASEKALIEMNFEEQKDAALKTLKQKTLLGTYKRLINNNKKKPHKKGPHHKEEYTFDVDIIKFTTDDDSEKAVDESNEYYENNDYFFNDESPSEENNYYAQESSDTYDADEEESELYENESENYEEDDDSTSVSNEKSVSEESYEEDEEYAVVEDNLNKANDDRSVSNNKAKEDRRQVKKRNAQLVRTKILSALENKGFSSPEKQPEYLEEDSL